VKIHKLTLPFSIVDNNPSTNSSSDFRILITANKPPEVCSLFFIALSWRVLNEDREDNVRRAIDLREIYYKELQ